MARTFNKAYDHINQMLNGSGLSSIVYRFNGGGFGFTEDDVATMQDWGGFTDPYPVSEEVTEKEFLGLTKGGWPSSQKFLQDFNRHNYNLETQRIKDKLKTLIDHGTDVTGDDWSIYTPSEQERLKDYFYKKQGIYKETDKIPSKFKSGDKGVPFKQFTGQPFNAPLPKLGQNIILPFMLKKELPDDKTAIGKVMEGAFGFPTPLNKQAWKERGLSTLLEKGKKAGIDPKVIEDVWDKEQKRVEDLSAEMYYEWSENEARKRRSGTNSATGGKVMPGGLSGIRKSININGEPHNLAWINSDEASVLKAMGGSGKKVDGIPAYFYSEEDFMIGGPELSEALGEDYYGESTPDMAPIPTTLPIRDLPQEPFRYGDRERVAREVDEAQRAVRGLHPSERRDRKISRDALRTTLEESLPTLERQRGPQELSQAYPWWAPFALPIKALGGIAGWLRGNTAPVIATVMVEGERMNLHEDGTLSEIRAGDQTTEDADLYKRPLSVQTAREGLTSTVKEDEEDKGIAALLASIKDKEHLLPQFNNIVAAGFSEQEAADMLGVPLDTFIT